MIKDLRAQFHHAVFDRRQNANRRIAVAVQQTQELAFGSQTKQRLVIVYGTDNRSRLFIPYANLESDDPLSACGQKAFAREDLDKELPAFERDFGLRRREGQPLEPGNVESLVEYSWRLRQALIDAGVAGAAGAEIDHIELTGPGRDPGIDGTLFISSGDRS